MERRIALKVFNLLDFNKDVKIINRIKLLVDMKRGVEIIIATPLFKLLVTNYDIINFDTIC